LSILSTLSTTSNNTQSEGNLSANLFKTRRQTYTKEKTPTPPKVSWPKKVAKESIKPMDTLNNEETLREHTWKELFSQFENTTNKEILPMSTSVTTRVLGMPAPGSRRAPDFDL